MSRARTPLLLTSRRVPAGGVQRGGPFLVRQERVGVALVHQVERDVDIALEHSPVEGRVPTALLRQVDGCIKLAQHLDNVEIAARARPVQRRVPADAGREGQRGGVPK